MAIFINWFGVDISAPLQSLPIREFVSWEESKKVHEELNLDKFAFARMSNKSSDEKTAVTYLINGPELLPDGFSFRELNVNEKSQVAGKIIEWNLAEHFSKIGFRVESTAFGIVATTPALLLDSIGLVVETGVECKYYYVRHERKHGITLDWKVRQFFENALSQFKSNFDSTFLGMPVTLTASLEDLDEDLKPYSGKYLGVLLSCNASIAEVLCRDGRKRTIDKSLLYPEARTDNVLKLSALTQADSLVREIQTLSYSLTQTGRRNLRIQQDKLKAAIAFLNPDSRPYLNITLQPYCTGHMSIDSAPATARTLQQQYV